MEALNNTPVPPAPLPNAQAGLRLSGFFRHRDFVQRALIAMAGLGLLTALAATLVALALIRQRIQVVALASNRTIILAEGSPLDDARELQEEIALLATSTLLTRGPKGPDFAELLPRLFSKDTQALAEQLRQNEQAEFAERQWQQKVVVQQVEALHGAVAEIRVGGYVVRAGPFGGDRLESVLPFSLRLTLTRNRDLLGSRRYPFIVTAFTLTYEPARP